MATIAAETKDESNNKGVVFEVPVHDHPVSTSPESARLARATRRFAGQGVEQVIAVFNQFDPERKGEIELHQLPAMCKAIGVKPWQAMRELDLSGNVITLPEFITWWFSPPIQATAAEKEQISNTFDKYDTSRSGKIGPADLVKLCRDLGIKPWQVFHECDIEGDRTITKHEFQTWWFRTNPAGNNVGSGAHSGPESPRRKHAVTPRKSSGKSHESLEARIAAAMDKVKAAVGELDLLMALQREQAREHDN